MAEHVHVRGVTPQGRIVEMVLLADSQEAAKRQAQDAGLTHIVARAATADEQREQLHRSMEQVDALQARIANRPRGQQDRPEVREQPLSPLPPPREPDDA